MYLLVLFGIFIYWEGMAWHGMFRMVPFAFSVEKKYASWKKKYTSGACGACDKLQLCPPTEVSSQIALGCLDLDSVQPYLVCTCLSSVGSWIFVAIKDFFMLHISTQPKRKMGLRISQSRSLSKISISLPVRKSSPACFLYMEEMDERKAGAIL